MSFWRPGNDPTAATRFRSELERNVQPSHSRSALAAGGRQKNARAPGRDPKNNRLPALPTTSAATTQSVADFVANPSGASDIPGPSRFGGAGGGLTPADLGQLMQGMAELRNLVTLQQQQIHHVATEIRTGVQQELSSLWKALRDARSEAAAPAISTASAHPAAPVAIDLGTLARARGWPPRRARRDMCVETI